MVIVEQKWKERYMRKESSHPTAPLKKKLIFNNELEINDHQKSDFNRKCFILTASFA